MLPRRHSPTRLPDDLMAEVIRLLGTGRREDRMAATQLLTRGYLDDEERRVAERAARDDDTD